VDTTTRSGRCRTALVGVAVSSILLAGCGEASSDHDPSATPDDAASSTSPSPTVAPASGDVADTTFFSAHAPKGWRVDVVVPDFYTVAGDPDGGSDVSFGIAKTYGTHFTLAQLARHTLGSYPEIDKALDVDLHSSLAGEPAYRIHGPLSGGGELVAYGASHEDRHITVLFELYAPLGRRQRSQVVDSVLASWQWK
jgi:hypothetical protein